MLFCASATDPVHRTLKRLAGRERTQSQDKNPLLVMDLMRCTNVAAVETREAPYTFELTLPNRVVHLAADTRHELTEWLAILKQVITALSGATQQSK